MPAYQTFVFRLNQLEQTFQIFGRVLIESLTGGIDPAVDSMPVMLASDGHSDGAKVAREIAEVGYCAAKKTRFHGIRRHFIGKRRSYRLPVAAQVFLAFCRASRREVSEASKYFFAKHNAVRRSGICRQKAGCRFSSSAHQTARRHKETERQRTIEI